MDVKIELITSNNTWELCELPTLKKVVGLKWIYNTKYNVEEKFQKLKIKDGC